MQKLVRILTATAAVLAASAIPGSACTNILVSKKASKDGSVMLTYAADSHVLYGELYFKAGGIHRSGTVREVVEWDTGKFLGRIPEAPVTYTRVGNQNEFQVAIGETTYGGRPELAEGQSGIIDYGSLIYIALERARTAREAIDVMARLVEEHGFYSSGESFSIVDKNEAWIMDMIGKGKGQKGALWVAWKLPEGTISAHANQARIRQFPLNDPANCLYAKDVISFAREKGWYKGEDKDFSFTDVYAPLDHGAQRFCEARVWSVFRRAAPGQELDKHHLDYVRGIKGAKPLPLFLKPDKPLSVQDVMELMRDHYEGTEFDMTQGVGAGPYQLPYRWRPMTWKLDGETYLHERAISTQQTGFSFVTQSRAWLPDPVGGVQWFGVDDTFTTVYFPVYCGVKATPRTFGEGSGSFAEFSWDSAFWIFNWVTNAAYGRWSDMIVDIQKVQRELEDGFVAEQAEIDAHARKLFEQSPAAARDYLTQYTCTQGDRVTARWKKLGEFLMWKYNDGNVRANPPVHSPSHPRYRDDWYRTIVKEKGNNGIKVPKEDGAH